VTNREAFEAHIQNASWYRVLSEAANDDDDSASIFRMARMAASEAWFGAIERCLKIVETYEVSVGNSAAGEIACEMTMANLREIRDEMRALAKDSA
jgi:hypothetical protein